ncbi:polyketide synthase [Sclerotinia borealis F-4128]|uniref:Polyketide synthase n=1 Tax=Sclerotinia borealis (strain F-4128) TaxID=1432307 RepID=W9C924_SCLBF|nr:polyketide synthase [Sclerotinia borealis F-4128]
MSTVSAEVLTLLNETFLLPFSATDSTSLANRVSQLGVDRIHIADLAYTFSNRRYKLPARGFLLARQSELKQNSRISELQTQMASRNNQTDSAFAFIFTGQGAQWAGMGKGNGCGSKMTVSITPSILEGVSQMNEVTHSKSACTAIQIALIDTLVCWGIKPQGFVGHSSGEIAAVYAANYLTSGQAIIIAYYQGHVVGKLPSTGQMMAVGNSEEQGLVEIKKAELQGKLVILVSTLQAYHSHDMKTIGQEYEDLVNSSLDVSKALSSNQADVLFLSSVTAETKGLPADSGYWRVNLESPVVFSQTIQALQSGRKLQLIELDPHAALKLPVIQFEWNWELAKSIYLIIDSKTVGVMVKDLPPYPWTYDQVLWKESRASLEFRQRKFSRHELLGSLITGDNPVNLSWRNLLNVKDVPWLEDHKFGQTIVFPAAAFVGMAIEAKSQVHGKTSEGSMEPSAIRNWYRKLIKEGLNFGAGFQSIKKPQIHYFITHKNPTLRILELGAGQHHADFTDVYLDILRDSTEFSRHSSFTTGKLIEGDIPIFKRPTTSTEVEKWAPYISEDHFDLVILTEAQNSDSTLGSRLEIIARLSSPSGLVVARSQTTITSLHTVNDFDVTSCKLKQEGYLILAKKHSKESSKNVSVISNIILAEDKPSDLGEIITEAFKGLLVSVPVTHMILSEINSAIIASNAAIIVIAEKQKNLFSTLKFFTLDIDDNTPVTRTTQNILDILAQKEGSLDFEFVQQNGVIHVTKAGENATCGLEYSGFIKSIGCTVQTVAAGVVVMASHYFKLVERVPHWACVKMEKGEDFNTVSTLPVAFSTAIYALHDRARIQPRETVLNHSGAGGLGITAIQNAKLAGAAIFTTVGSHDKREYLIETFGINPSHIFNSRDSSLGVDS